MFTDARLPSPLIASVWGILRKICPPVQGILLKQTVSQFVIPAKSRETGGEPGPISSRHDDVFMDSGSLFASRRSSGMTLFSNCVTAWKAGKTRRMGPGTAESGTLTEKAGVNILDFVVTILNRQARKGGERSIRALIREFQIQFRRRKE